MDYFCIGCDTFSAGKHAADILRNDVCDCWLNYSILETGTLSPSNWYLFCQALPFNFEFFFFSLQLLMYISRNLSFPCVVFLYGFRSLLFLRGKKTLCDTIEFLKGKRSGMINHWCSIWIKTCNCMLINPYTSFNILQGRVHKTLESWDSGSWGRIRKWGRLRWKAAFESLLYSENIFFKKWWSKCTLCSCRSHFTNLCGKQP